MKPSLYFYKQNENGIELYFNEFSTVDGLQAIDKSDRIKIISIGATLYKDYGFATEKEFPEFNEPDKLIDFLNQSGEIGLIDFEVEIVGKGKMNSHDDGECHFKFKSKKDGIKILKKITPLPQSDLIISTLFKNSGIYISVDEKNNVKKFATFDEYIKKSENQL